MIDGKQMCAEKREGPPPRCGRRNKLLGLDPFVTYASCSAQIHKSCVPKNKEAICTDKFKGIIRPCSTKTLKKP